LAVDVNLDWKSIAGAVAPLAPKLGAVLGAGFGPLGSIIGGLAGNAIAATFGVEATPDAIGRAIAEDPDAAKKLAALDAEKGAAILAQAKVEVARLEQATAQSSVINETIRAELAVVPWWHWRHLCGYVTMLWGLMFVGGGARLMLFGGDIGQFTALVTAATPVFLATAALNGYIAADTTNMKNTVITGEHSAGGIMNTLRAASVAARRHRNRVGNRPGCKSG
jgi:hypothetical protein